MVYPQLDRALLFPATKSRDATASVGLGIANHEKGHGRSIWVRDQAGTSGRVLADHFSYADLSGVGPPDPLRSRIKNLASLNHPNIATIHGLEQSNGTNYLVMELVAGETLADRIKSDGALPLVEALEHAEANDRELKATNPGDK